MYCSEALYLFFFLKINLVYYLYRKVRYCMRSSRIPQFIIGFTKNYFLGFVVYKHREWLYETLIRRQKVYQPNSFHALTLLPLKK